MSFISFGLFSIIIFLLISIYMLSLSFSLLTFENPIYAIFLLVLVFFGSSFLLIELNLLFLSLMILIVYLGALIVLFLFVVMMLNIKSLELNRVINFFPFIFIFASAFFLIFLSNGFNFFTMNTNLTLFLFYSFEWQSLYYLTGLFFSIGFYLYTFGSVFLVLISIILLLAMFGAIILTLTPFKHFLKQNSVDQLFQLRYLENINFKL
jgi:NADH:ubiquinone oxidoreductase subunit 6 (subunit J)